MINTQLWAGNFEEVIRYSNLAFTEYSNKQFQIQKALALEGLDRNREAKEILKEIILNDPENTEALALQTRIFQKK
jgi:hypothetical protein